MKTIAALLLCLGALYASEKPVALYPHLGVWTHPIDTTNPEGQKYFDQGLVLNYGFNRYEALRSFRKAAELDPHSAMPYFGIAISLGPYVNMDMDPDVHLKEACDAVKTGLAIPGISETDRDWLNAAGSRCPEFDPARNVEAMKRLADRYPDDPDAQTFYAEAQMLTARWHWYDNNGRPAPGIPDAERALESVMRRFPYHPGANHLYIHVVESSPTPERAIPSAQRLMGIVPAAGHLVHMPGHIWLVLGDYNNAVAVNERAAEVDREYFANTGVMSSYYAYYLHNLQFIVYSRSMQGRLADTRAAAKQFREALEPMSQMMPEMVDVFGIVPTLAELRMGRWDDLLAVPKPKADNPAVQTFWHITRAMAFAGKDQLDEARREQSEFERLRKSVDRNVPWGNNKLVDVLELASVALGARVAPSAADAVPKWKRAVDLQDALAYDEPPAWYYPVRESLGAALLQSGDAPAAEVVFREGLRRSPKNGRMLFGLLATLREEGKTVAAAWVQKEFEAAWKGADIDLKVRDL